MTTEARFFEIGKYMARSYALHRDPAKRLVVIGEWSLSKQAFASDVIEMEGGFIPDGWLTVPVDTALRHFVPLLSSMGRLPLPFDNEE